MPVHFETLVTAKYRLPYMAAINALDDKARSALILHVRGADMDAPMGSLTEVCRLARTLTRRIMVEVDPRTIRLERFNDSGSTSSRLLRRHPKCLPGGAPPAVFAAKLARQGIMLAVEECHDHVTLAGWLAIGPDYISGKAVAMERNQPAAPFRFTPGEGLETPGTHHEIIH